MLQPLPAPHLPLVQKVEIVSSCEGSPHLRELLIFIRETVHCIVEHLLHQTLLILCNKHCETLK